MRPNPLPIDAVLPRLCETLEQSNAAVLVAPAGAGKTTRIPPALLGAPWLRGGVVLLQPRRVAARAAAARIAQEREWCLGREVGYQVRFDRRLDQDTSIQVITEGILTRWIQRDPMLQRVGAVLLDEFHERSLHSDLGLALIKEIQRSVRPELRLIVMSATLDSEPVARYLDGCPVIQANVPTHPVEVVQLNRPRPGQLPQAISQTIQTALRDDPSGGDLLAFLPGVGEIERTAERLGSLTGVDVLRLHGSLPAAEQDRALTKGKRRRVVLATNVAETSVTVEGVTTVVDSGLARLPRHDPRYGIDRLELVRVSAASAAQRAGRAGRLGPGRVYRLWTAADHASLPAQTPAEVRRVDLASTVLELRSWGSDPARFDWLERPDAGALAGAEQLLCLLGALDPISKSTTALGRAMLPLPLHPRLARIVLEAAEHGCLREGAEIAALLSERDIVSRDTSPRQLLDAAPGQAESDVLLRSALLQQAEQGGFRGALQTPVSMQTARRVVRVRDALVDQLERSRQSAGRLAEREPEEATLLELTLRGYPDRVVCRRPGSPDRGLMVGGRGVVVDPRSVVHQAPLMVAIDADAASAEIRVRAASAIDPAWLETREEQVTRFDERQLRVVAHRRVLYQDLCLAEQACTPHPERAARLLAEAAARDVRRALDLSDAVQQWLTRARWLAHTVPDAGLPALGEEALERLLPALCAGKTSFEQLRREDLLPWLRALLDDKQRRALQRLAPDRLRVPSGRAVRLSYRDDGPPILAVRLQEMFGLAETPRVADGRIAVVLHLLGPNRRPVQVTQDLPSFWRTTYAEVRKQLRQRYPRHAWPEDPLQASPASSLNRRRHKR